MRTRFIAATLFAALALVLSACGGDEPAAFNDADVTFARDMIPHHQQATEMAALATERTENPDVLALAADIEKAQGPEIKTMTGWLKSWDKKVPDEHDSMAGMDGGSSDMPGMMSDTDMAGLEATSGSGFDSRFLTMMIAHHTGAISMAETEQTDGKFTEAVALAKKIQKDQTREITLMKSIMAS